MPATIKIKNSSTASAVPTSSDLVQGELAVNVTDRRIFTENASGTVVELGTNPTILTMGAAGSASAPVITRTGDTNTGIFFPAADTIAFAEGGVEAMRLDSAGNLGLGVTPGTWNSVLRALEIGGTTGSILNFKGSSSVSGAITFNARNDGSNWVYQNSTHAAKFDYNYDAGGAFTWQRAPSGTAGNAITFTQAMTLDASGNLLVGITSGTNKFMVGDGTRDMCINPNSNLDAIFLGTVTSKPLVLGTGNAERARIDSSGNLLVGQTTRSGTTVGFSVSPTGTVFTALSASTNGTTTWDTYSTGAGAYRFYVGMGGTVYATSTTISSISDIRFKENVRDLDAGLAEVLALKPRLYDWKEGKGADIKNARGFIAQEFEEVFPDLIDEWRDPAPEGEEPYKSVRADLIPVLVKAIQEQQTLIQDQLAIITSLTARIEALEQA
jgi:hypothetical protein